MHKTRILRSLLVTADNQTDISKLVAEMQACLSGASLILSLPFACEGVKEFICGH